MKKVSLAVIGLPLIMCLNACGSKDPPQIPVSKSSSNTEKSAAIDKLAKDDAAKKEADAKKAVTPADDRTDPAAGATPVTTTPSATPTTTPDVDPFDAAAASMPTSTTTVVKTT